MDIRNMFKVDCTLRFPEEIREETPEYRIVRNANGVLEKVLKEGECPSQPLEHELKTAADWDRCRERLVPDPDTYKVGRYGNYGYEYFSGSLAAVKQEAERLPGALDTFVMADLLSPFEAALA
jgi:hypothetical protein